MKTQPSAHFPSQKQILGTGAYKYAKTAIKVSQSSITFLDFSFFSQNILHRIVKLIFILQSLKFLSIFYLSLNFSIISENIKLRVCFKKIVLPRIQWRYNIKVAEAIPK